MATKIIDTICVEDGSMFKVEPVKFEDIQQGDVIFHVINQEQSGQSIWSGKTYLVWMGEVQEFLTNSNEWWSNVRYSGFSDGVEIPLSPLSPRRDDEHGVLVVAKWHEEEAGHSIYRAVA